MKKERIISLILSFVMLLGIIAFTVSCSDGNDNTGGGTEGPVGGNGDGDGNGNDTGDGGQTESETFELVTDGVANFNIVYGKGNSSEVTDKLDQMLEELNALGAGTSLKEDYYIRDIQDCEILIGEVDYRDGCEVDVHPLGPNGYLIKAVGERIVIAGGSDSALITAIDFFLDNYLKINDATDSLGTVTIAKDLYIEKLTDNYQISSISVSGNDISEYKIAVNWSDRNAYSGAQKLQAELYNRAGYWLDLVTITSEYDKAIVIREVDDAGTDGFRVSVSGDDLLIECSYNNAFEKGMTAFMEENIADKSGDVNFGPDFSFSKAVNYVKYSEFGAVGDGVTDDFDAIAAAHAFANAGGQSVYADENKSYYIGVHRSTITIKTDTYWGTSRFIIDDRSVSVSDKGYNVFVVASDYASTTLTGIDSLVKGQANIGISPGYDCMLLIVNDNYKNYIRYGANANSGTSQQEIIIVDKDGNVDPDTPILWDYTEVTKVTAYRIDDKPITISGGIFTTRANQAASEYNYYNRGINIARSNTTVVGLKHYITDEGSTGAPYSYFLGVNTANNVLIKDCLLTGHKTYKNSSNVSMGTYDTQATRSNNVTWQGCTQTNGITDSKYWGIMASNFCKNLTYNDCHLSRFDAHMGMYNATIVDSTIGQAINAIGAGTLRVENTLKYGNTFIGLRSDYGSTWDGDMIIKDCTISASTAKPTIISASWISHNFGYTCYLPKSVTIDNLKLANKATSIQIFSQISSRTDIATDPVNPYVITEEIILKNMSGISYTVSPNTAIFKNTEIRSE